jgi:hypothetical protein
LGLRNRVKYVKIENIFISFSWSYIFCKHPWKHTRPSILILLLSDWRLPQNIQFLCYNCTVLNPETNSFRPIQIVSSHCSWWTAAERTTIIIRNHFQCNARLVPRTYEIHIIKIEYPEKVITSMKVFSKYIHFLEVWSMFCDGRKVSFHKACKQSNWLSERLSWEWSAGSQLTSFSVSSHFARTSHKRSKQWYSNE